MGSPEKEIKNAGSPHRVKPPSNMVPPDGGYGWVVVFGSCLIMFVKSSVMFCFGLVYVHLVGRGYSNTQVAIIPAIMNATSNLLAPISTALSRFYSHRRLAIIGSITLSLGLMLCSFSSHIAWFYLCYGFVIGLGNSLVQPQGLLLSQKYFHKKRVAANGFSVLGGSLCFMTVPFLISYFVQEYSFQGSFLLWAGVALQGTIGACLYHPVQWHMKQSKTIPLEVLPNVQKASNLQDVPERTEVVGEDQSSYHASDTQPRVKIGDQTYNDDENQGQKAESDTHSQLLLRSGGRTRTLSQRSNTGSIFGTTDAIDDFGSTLSIKIENMKIEHEEKDKQSKGKVSSTPDYCLCCGITLPKINDIINFSLFKNPAFLISAFGSICNRMVYLSFVTYLPSVALDIGVAYNSSYLFSIMAICELSAKVIISIISDLGFMPRRYFIIIASVCAAISISSLTFAGGFWSLAICCGCYGFSIGTQMCVGPILLVEYLGLKLLPYTYGLLLFMNGFGGIFIFSLTGVINDLADSYLTTYLGISVLSIIPGILWSIINFCPKVGQDSEESPA